MGTLLSDHNPKRKPLWNCKQAAEFLGLDEETVRHGRAGTGEIPRIKLGRSVRFDPDDVAEFRERRRQASVARIERRFKRAS
jgi:excisionase family DNA binding protein